jgi:hypothetical protein
MRRSTTSQERPDGGGTVVGLTAVILSVTDEAPRVLIARRMQHPLATPAQRGQPAPELDSPITLPFGPFDPAMHRTLEAGLREWVEEQSGLALRYVEQLYTFGNRYRDARELYGGPRVVSVAYLALTQETPVAGSGEAEWRDWYSFLPWEDWRDGRPPLIDRVIRPELERWVTVGADADTRRQRAEQVTLCFGFDDAGSRNFVRTLERFELLYEAGLVVEALRDRQHPALAVGRPAPAVDAAELALARHLGEPMSLDNRRILAAALGRLRGKVAYRPLVFELLPPEFTLYRLQRVVEALSGMRLHKQNFRRTLMTGGLVEPTGRLESRGRGRPAELYRFRRDVILARPQVGIGLPAVRAGD